jgi:hypothetical protein
MDNNEKLYSIKWKQAYSLTTPTPTPLLALLLVEKLYEQDERDLNNSNFEEANLIIDRIKKL